MIPEPVAFLIDWSCRASVLIVGALAVAALMKRFSAESRHFVLRCGLAGAVLLPLGMWSSAAFSPSLPPPMIKSVQAVVSTPVDQVVSSSVDESQTTPNLGQTQEPASSPFEWWPLVVSLYATGVVFCLGRWGASYLRILQVTRTAYSYSPNGDYLVCRGDVLTVPVTFGSLHPVILFPAESAEWPAERLEAALLHEQAHVVRRDWLWLTIATLFNAIHWFNPIGWMLTSFLRSTSEESADDFVLHSGISPSMYTKQLLYFASRARLGLSSSTSMARSGDLSSRLRRILQSDPSLLGLKSSRTLALCAVFGGCTLALGNYSHLVVQKAHGVAHWSDGTEADIVSLQNVELGGAAWDADGSVVKSDSGSSGALAFGGPSTDASKRLIAVTYVLKAHTSQQRDGLAQVQVKLVGGEAVGGSSSSSAFSASGGRNSSSGGSKFSKSGASPGGFASAGAGRGGDASAGGSASGSGASSGLGESESPQSVENQETQGMTSFSVPTTLTSTALMLGKGVGSYNQEEQDGGGVSSWPVKKSIQKQHVVASKSENGVTKDLSHDVIETVLTFPISKSTADKDWKIVAYGQDGQPLKMESPGFGPVAIQKGTKYFRAEVSAAPTEISRIVLMSRELEWITVPHVKLAAGAN